jgi:DNA-binding XRE family transcriptional regulator
MLHNPSSYSSFSRSSAREIELDRLSIHSAPLPTVNGRQAYGGQPAPLQSALPILPNASTDLGAHRDVGTRFGRRLRELRRTHGMTQLDMAVMLGIDRSYISEVECGKIGISLATLEVISLGFRIRLSDLMRDL